jgi:hypothetical protein
LTAIASAMTEKERRRLGVIPTEIAEALHTAISINSRSPQYFYILSTVESKLGNYKESQEAIETFRKLEAEMAARAKLRRDSLDGVFGSKGDASD